MIPTLKNYFSGRWRRLALLAVWLALSSAIIFSLSRPQDKQAKVQNAAPQVAAATDRLAAAAAPPARDPHPAATDARELPPSNNSPRQQPSQTPKSPPAPKPAPKNATVVLNIDDAFQGSVTLPAGSNHCDVLAQALKDGTIHSLDMRYSEAHKSYGVYVINGVGDSENLNWTYKVNNRPPPVGCTHLAVNNGDSINWEYVK